MSLASPTAPPVTRSCPFGPLLVTYDDRVLAPREWTFAQSAWAAELAVGADAGPILELCAGAGHIGLAAAFLAGRGLVQVDADAVATGYAVVNATRAGWADRVEVRTARLLDAVHPGERFPLVIADPPYLPTAEVSRWPADPVTAIDGGPDGLEVIRACLEVAAAHVTVGGYVLLQVAGPDQADRVSGLLGGIPGRGLRRRGLRVIDEERAILLLVRD